jgi:hypothetical protein
MTTPYESRVHHIDPVSVTQRYVDLYQTLYGENAGRAFGMTADFTERNGTYAEDYFTAKANGTARTDYPNLMELPKAMALTVHKTTRETVEAALELLVMLKSQEAIRAARGKLRWEGDLEAMRLGL